MSAIAEITIFPVDKGPHLSSYVAPAISVIRESGIPFVIGPMGTTIEGEWPEVLDVVDRCVRAVKNGSDRVYCVIKVDYSSGDEERMQKKVETVTEITGGN
jgi:uncharacterized protein (TIGR00106 family)